MYEAGAAFFTLEPEPELTQVGRSRSRLRDLGHLEPEPPKKVAAPQHWLRTYTRRSQHGLMNYFELHTYRGTVGKHCGKEPYLEARAVNLAWLLLRLQLQF